MLGMIRLRAARPHGASIGAFDGLSSTLQRGAVCFQSGAGKTLPDMREVPPEVWMPPRSEWLCHHS